MELYCSSRRSSGVEQLIRNQQVAGSNPIAGSIKNQPVSLLFPLPLLLSQPQEFITFGAYKSSLPRRVCRIV